MLLANKRLLTRHYRRHLIALAVIAGWSIGAGARAATVTLLPQRQIPPVPCEAHVLEDGATEQVAHCGQPILTAGKHAVGWIETPTAITPFLTDVTGGGEIEIRPLVPSGAIELSPGDALGPGERIRLVSLHPPQANSALRPLFQREVTSREPPLHMPAGRAIALLIGRGGNVIGASRPIEIIAGAKTVAWPAKPKQNGSVLVAWLKRGLAAERLDQDRVTIAAIDSRGSHSPDAFVNASDAIFAVWYTLTETRDRLAIDSREWRLARDVATLAPGTVTLVQETLQPLPKLTVVISALPERALRIDGKMLLTIAPVEGETAPVRSLSVEPGKSYTIDSVPASILTVELQIGEFTIERPADLTSGADATVAIPLEPIVVVGTVYKGDEPARAQVRVQQKVGALVVDTDDRGSYELTLWQKRRYIIDTTLAERPDMPPFSQNVSISAPQTLDIHVPANVLSAHVYDADSGKPIDGARIAIMNRWTDETGSHSAASTVLSKGELTTLPPQRVGMSQINVHAEGYSEFPPMSLTIDENLRNRAVEVPLKKTGHVTHVQINLEGDRPAAGAEMAAWNATGDFAWLGTADDAGQIAVPDQFAGHQLLIRHPMGASVVVLFSPGDPVTIPLAPPAPSLVVRVVHRDQSRIGTTAAQLTIWFGGVRLSGAVAAFATWSMGATSGDGVWIGKGLPRESVRILFTRLVSIEQISSNSLDGLATTIPYPWSSSASVVLANE